MTRQIILDTETTGLDPRQGHRLIEIGCVEMIDRCVTGNTFHQYLQPDRQIDAEAEAIHGISNAFLADKPRFAEVAHLLMDYLRGAELIIHNAPFDIGFLNYELQQLQERGGAIEDYCTVTDTLVMARQLYPGQRNTLDALCKRYNVNNAHRTLHGALLDAEILADVYLAMTGGQVSLLLSTELEKQGSFSNRQNRTLDTGRLRVIPASASEVAAHTACLAAITRTSGGKCLWQP